MSFRFALFSILFNSLWLYDARGGAVDLSPVPSSVQFDGASAKCVAFRADDGRIEYNPPWPISGNPSQAQLAVPFAGANANIAVVITDVPITFANDQVVTAFLKQFLPKDAEHPQFQSLVRNPVRISGKESAELVATYSLFGRPLQLSTLMTQRAPGTELFLFQVSGPASDFKKIHRTFQSSLYSITGF